MKKRRHALSGIGENAMMHMGRAPAALNQPKGGKQMRTIQKPVALLLTLALTLLSLCSCSTATPYYTRIDNTKVQEQTPSGGVIDPTGGMEYRYALTAYSETGDKTELTFGTSRILREGAYLKLTTLPMRGVTNWEEVAWEDLPEKVREQYPQ